MCESDNKNIIIISMNANELKISELTIWKKNGQRPHEPLLILYALSMFQNANQVVLPYEQLRAKLKSLLIEFGPVRRTYHSEEPFVRLKVMEYGN